MAKATAGTNLTAVGLEVVPGFFLQTFGIGHLYTGRVGTGLAIMFSYWGLQAINAWLSMFGIGIVTGFLTWLAYTVMAPTNVLQEHQKS